MSKFKSENLFSLSKEDHTEETVKELDEQGAISHADAEEVVAPVEPSADVQEAGDDIGQATPKEEIGADYKADITSTSDDASAPNGGGIQTDVTNEMTELLQEGTAALAAKDSVVEEAVSEATGADAGVSSDTDVNGNPVTPEQAEVNSEEDTVEDEVDSEVDEANESKDIHQEAAEVDEQSDEELGDAIDASDDDTPLDGADDIGGDPGDVASGDAPTDDVSTDTTVDAGGEPTDSFPEVDTGSDETSLDDTSVDETQVDEVVADTEVAADDQSMGDVTDESTADDTPLEGADDAMDTGTDTDALDPVDADAPADSIDPVDTATEPTDDTPVEDIPLPEVDGDVATDVDARVEKQNEAADVTAEAASADSNQTAFIANEDPGQSGDLSENGDEVINDGAEVVAEAEPAVQVTEDVTTANSGSDDTEEDDDTPLEGADDLNIDVDDSIVQDDKDTGDSDGSAATVEESTTDQTAEDLDDGLADAEAAADEVAEDAGEVVVEETDVSDDGQVEVETEEVIDTESGEVEETEEEANFDEGEVDIKDVDTDTTDEDVEEAMVDAAEVGEWGDEEAKKAEEGEKTIEELQKESEALEGFIVLLEEGISNESYNPGLLAYWNHCVEPLRKRLTKVDDAYGTNIAPPRVAVENYDYRDMDLAYKATLESFRGMASRILTLSTSLLHKVERWWSRDMVDRVTSRADALDKLIDLQLTKLKDSDFSTKEVSAGSAYLASNETNIVKVVAADLALTTEIATKGIKASEQLQTNLVKGVNDLVSAGSEKDIDKALDGIAALKTTKTSFPSGAQSKGLLGGFTLEFREESGSDRADKIEALGHNGIPVGTKSSKVGDNKSYTMSKGDFSNLLKMAKGYVALARKLANTTGDRAISIATQVRTTRNRALPLVADHRIRGDEVGVDAAATAMSLLAQAHVDLYKFITKHCCEVAEALANYSKKATK